MWNRIWINKWKLIKRVNKVAKTDLLTTLKEKEENIIIRMWIDPRHYLQKYVQVFWLTWWTLGSKCIWVS